MPKQLILNQITLCADGSIGLQWLKQVTDPDTGVVLFSEPHRSVIDFDGDPDATWTSVATHLQQMGYPVPPTKGKVLLKKILALGLADPDILAKRQAKIDAKAAAIAAGQVA